MPDPDDSDRLPQPGAVTDLAPAAADWWRGAVIYQIYTRSFADSNGDGTGDLRGICARLDYVASLGVDAIWIAPFFRSPMQDFGYDVSDYRQVDQVPECGAGPYARRSSRHERGVERTGLPAVSIPSSRSRPLKPLGFPLGALHRSRIGAIGVSRPA